MVHRALFPVIALLPATMVLFPGMSRSIHPGAVQAPAPAQQATPTASSSQLLAESSVAAPPPPPVVVALARLTFAPGAGVGDLVVSGPQLIHVESGVLTVRMPGEVEEGEDVEEFLTRSATPRPAPSQITPDDGSFKFTLYPGDGLVIPSDTPHSIENLQRTAAVVLAVAITPQPAESTGSSWPPSGSGVTLPPGIDIESLDVGYAFGTEAPRGPARIRLIRATVVDGVLLPRHQADGIELISIEQGALALVVESGEISFRSSASGDVETIRREEGTTPAVPVVVAAGSAVLVQPGTIATVRSSGGEPLVALLLTVLPA